MENKSDREHLRQILRESLLNKPDRVLDSNFPQQSAFINHPARLKSLFCTRRAAKSYTGGLYLIKECLQNPGVNGLFIGLTRLSAEGIVWKDIIKEIDRKFELNMKFNESKLTGTLPNGSVIWLAGIDSTEDEMNKLLGKKYRLVILDEASLYSVNLRHLIYGILKPAVADNRGTICMMGTSSNITRGLFYDITTGKEPGWQKFTWTAHDNPYVQKQWKEELEDIAANRPMFMQTPLFKQWYLNEWVIDTDKLVYKFSESNFYEALPMYQQGEWNYVLGVDLGYSPDPSAFVLAAFHSHDRCLYILDTYKQLEMDITDVANKIKEYQLRYSIYKVVIDGANKQAIEEMQKRHNVALTSADKTGKADFIQLMNDDFVQKYIKLSPKCTDLSDEYQTLVWQTDMDKIVIPRKEHSGLANHLCDAALYAWRFCYPFLAETLKPKTNLKESWGHFSQKLADESLESQIQHQQAEAGEIDTWNTMGLDEPDVFNYYLNKRRK